MRILNKRLSYFSLIGLLVLAVFTSTLGMAPPASALTAATVTDGTDYTSINSYYVDQCGGGVYNDGTYIYTAESQCNSASQTQMQFSRYTISSGAVATATAAFNPVNQPTNPASAVGSTTRTDQFYLQSIGGSTQALVTGSTTILAEKVATASSELVGKTTNSVHLWLKKTCAASCSGTARVAVMNSVGTEAYVFGTIDCNGGVTTSYVEYTFSGAASGRTLASGDYIGIFFNGGSAGNTCDVEYVNADRFDGTTNTIAATCTGTQGAATCSDQTAREVHMELDFIYSTSLANDDNTSTFWENGATVVRAVQTDSDTTTALASAGASATPTAIGAFEKKTSSSTLAVSQDEIKLRLSKTGSPTGTIQVVEVSATGSISNKVNQASGTTSDCNVASSTPHNACAEHINSGAALIGQTVNSMTIALKRVNSPTGTGSACVLDNSNACTYTFGTIDLSTLGTSYAQYTFTNYASSYTVVLGARIGIKGDTQTGANTVATPITTTQTYDSTNSEVAQFTSGSWAADLTRDLGSSTASQAWKLDLVTAPTILNTYNTMSAASLTTSEAIYTFTSTTDFTPSSGATTYIGVLYTGQDAIGNTVNVARTSADAYDGTTNSIFSSFANGAFTDTTTSDLRFRIIDNAKNDQEAGAYLYIDLSGSVADEVGGFKLTFADTTKIPTIQDMQSSTDAVSWTDRRADVTVTQSTSAQVIEFYTAPATSARYWRILVDTYGASDDSLAVAEFDYLQAGEEYGKLSNFHSDGTIHGFACIADTCAGSGTVEVVRIDLASLFSGANQYTLASLTQSISGNQGYFGVSQTKVYIVDYDCSCTSTTYLIKQMNYDLSGSVTALGTMTESNVDTQVRNGKGMLAIVTSGGVDTLYHFVRGDITADGTGTTFWILRGSSGSADVILGKTTLATVAEPVIYHAYNKIYAYLTVNDSPFVSNKITYIVDTLNAAMDSSSPDNTDYISYPMGDNGAVASGVTTYSSAFKQVYLAYNDGGTETRLHSIDQTTTSSTTNGIQAPLYVETKNSITGEFKTAGNSRFYFTGQTASNAGIFLTSASISGTSWTWETVSGSSHINATWKNEDLIVALQTDSTDVPLWTNQDIFFAACDGLYHLHSTSIYVNDVSDCEQYIIKDTSANSIGRELPFTLTPTVVWTDDYTNYNIALTVVTGTVTDYYVKIVYDGTDVDVNDIDTGGNVEIRLLDGQCYTIEYLTQLADELVQSNLVCADSVIFKTAVLSTDLGFTFWSSVWGGSHVYNSTSHVLTTITNHETDTPPYMYDVNIYNATGALLITDHIVGVPSGPDTQTYNMSSYLAQKPFKLELINEDGHRYYLAWFDQSGGWLGDIRTAFGDWTFAGWTILDFLPIIFAAIFTRNTAGLAGGMVATFICVALNFGILPDDVLTQAIMGLIIVIAIIGILAYRFLYQ